MIRIAIPTAAFDALAATLPIVSVAVEPKLNEKGEREIWLEPPGPRETAPPGLPAAAWG
jgi:hypothetical protein